MSDALKMLNVREAASRLGCSKGWLDILRVKGGGPTFIKIGQKVWYDPADLTAWLESHKRPSTSEGPRP